MGLFSHHNKNPSKEAMPYYEEAKNTVQQGYQPYIDKGNAAGNVLTPIYEQMAQDPAAFLNALMQQYQPSKGYQYKSEQLGRELGNTAAAGGISGTPEHQRQQGELTDNLLSQDMDKFLQSLLGIFGQGVQGEQGFYNQGYQASGNKTSDLSNILGTQGTLAYKGAQQENEDNNSLMKLFSNALGAAANYAIPGSGGLTSKVSNSLFGGSNNSNSWNDPGYWNGIG